LSSPLNVLHPAYHSASELLKPFGAGARATQYGCAILHVGDMELLNSCRKDCGMPWLCARSAQLHTTPLSNNSHNFHAFGQSKKNESSGPKTNVISGIAPPAIRCFWRGRISQVATVSTGCPVHRPTDRLACRGALGAVRWRDNANRMQSWMSRRASVTRCSFLRPNSAGRNSLRSQMQ
jgi:hypothetical protein